MPRIENAEPEAITLADWGQFKVDMFRNPAYQRVSRASDTQTVARIETFFSIQAEELAIAVQLWQGLLYYCETDAKPTAAEAAQWDEIASANSMPFEFTETGQLSIKEI